MKYVRTLWGTDGRKLKVNDDIDRIIKDKTQPSPQTMFENKMGGVTNVPKQEVEVKSQTGDNTEKGAVVKPARDPYREAIL